jgi:CheY-like chemotaxis protein
MNILPKTVLVVEDLPRTLAGSLAELRYRFNVGFDCVGSIAEGIERLQRNSYDAVLLDWRIPPDVGTGALTNGGLEVLKALGEMGQNKGVPVVVVSAQAVDGARVGPYPQLVAVVSKLHMNEIITAMVQALAIVELDQSEPGPGSK